MTINKDPNHKNPFTCVLSSSALVNFILILNASLVLVESSSTPKNLVNLYTHSSNNNEFPNSNNSNSSITSNEYQFRQGTLKANANERHKPQASTISSLTSSDALFEHVPPNDLSNSGTSDYSYHDDKGTTTNVPECKGRLKLVEPWGYITDGPGSYMTNLQCVWLIDSGRDNATIRIQFHQFNTECNYDYLYIFDGDSIYSPLIAALSGDMKDFSSALLEKQSTQFVASLISRNQSDSFNASYSNHNITVSSKSSTNSVLSSEPRPFELKTKSGKAFIYFHSDTAQTMPGFYLTYSIDSCSLDCSNRGECDFPSLKCRCNPGYFGEGCQFLLCPNNCTSPRNGFCDNEKSCICNPGFHGPDCSLRADKQTWTDLQGSQTDFTVSSRAFHQVIVIDGIMYVIGGKTSAFTNTNIGIFRISDTPMIYGFDIENRKWLDYKIIGKTGIDHLAEVTGHSVAAKGNKIFIYGGMAMNNTILNAMSVFDTKSHTLTSLLNNNELRSTSKIIEDDFILPIAVVGHTANIIDSHMYIFLGFNPLFGYINFVQKFNLADNSWSIVNKKGSSISGLIGHTSIYDPSDGLVYVYGGHNAHKTSSLYSFDPNTEVWTFLQPGPSPRYYHSSVIVNKRLIVLGGNSYNTSYLSDQCFQQTYLSYDLSCSKPNFNADLSASSGNMTMCGRRCWQTVVDLEPNILKRHGHTTVYHKNEIILFGGFNGILMNDLKIMNISSCQAFDEESECNQPKLALNCYWDAIDRKCENQQTNQFNTSLTTGPELLNSNCTKSDTKALQTICESRESCTDCLSTNQNCVWCGFTSRCNYAKCKSNLNNTLLSDPEMCYKDEYMKNPLIGLMGSSHSLKDLQFGQDFESVLECKRLDNCHLCHTKPQCSWQNDGCSYNAPPSMIPTSVPMSTISRAESMMNDMNQNNDVAKSITSNSTTRFMRKFDPFHRSLLATLTSSLLNTSPHSCDPPCYMRRSCHECTSIKCIWCSTSEQCVDSSAYFAYHSMGQCMHYVAHTMKCSVASCAGIESCDKCLTNPKCGWLNDISNTGKGRCIEGTSAGPSFGNFSSSLIEASSNQSTSLIKPPLLDWLQTSWFYTSCPACQCNGHSICRTNSSICMQPCHDNTEGTHCDRCVQGYYGEPSNGGTCRQCECNGHAQSCQKENGKCNCYTKGITGHTCNRCDDHYIGDLTSSGNGTCYYNLTTDYQYTFNMSKHEDHYYSEVNFINVPSRRDSDVDFTVACSRLALINITHGTSYKNRKSIHSGLECGSFRLRFPHDRNLYSDSNYSFFVHVYKFQTPLILQIAFSQHRTLYLPQFFFTFSSCFLFFFALSGLVWKLKHEYDIYARRQRLFIELKQMASRPFSTVLLEMFRPNPKIKDNVDHASRNLLPEPTPVSFEPCFGNNIGVMSVFVQLPGKPNLAIGSALVTLNDEFTNDCDDYNSKKRSEKEQVSV